jgi:predicted transcriptional regulator
MEGVHAKLVSLSGGAGDSGDSRPTPQPDEAATEYEPAVSVRKSLGSREHIISLIDGKPYKSLKRHLGSHGMTPTQYRERYGLKADYPMVAPAYAERRRALAKKIGLGRKPGEAAAGRKAAAAKARPAKAGRRPRAAKAKQ